MLLSLKSNIPIYIVKLSMTFNNIYLFKKNIRGSIYY